MAIKALPAHLAERPELRQRREREYPGSRYLDFPKRRQLVQLTVN